MVIPAHLRVNQRGQVLLLVMITMVPICLVLGLVADVGMAYYTKTSARAAAQTAALAAVQRVIDGISANGWTYTCSSPGQGPDCESSLTKCPAINASSNLQSACAYASQNGFSGSDVLIASGTSNPPVSGVSAVNYWVQVQIVQQNPLTFGMFSGMQSLTIATSSVAAAANMMPQNCVVGLNQSSSAVGLNLNGNVTLATVGCGVAVDSSNSTSALSATGNITLTAPSIDVVGGCSGCSSIENVRTDVPYFADPLEGVPAPQVPNGCGSVQSTSQATFNHTPNAPLQPGIYYGGILVRGNASVTFSAGTYCLVGGGLTASGNTTLTGSSVAFYNTFDNTHSFAPISVTGNVTLDLSAPSSGSLEDMLFFEDRNAPSGNTNTITGNSSMTITGALYFPNNQLAIDGNAASQQLMMVANTITTSGNATDLSIDPQAGATTITPQISAALIQ